MPKEIKPPKDLSTKNFIFDARTTALTYLERDNDGKVHRIKLTRGFYPVSLFRDVDTKEIFIRLVVNFRDKLHTAELTLNELPSSKLLEYAKYGFPFADSYVRNLLSQWLIEMIDILPIYESTKGLGWKTTDGIEYFQLERSISTDASIDVRYSGDLLIGKRGTRDKYWDILNKNVVPYIQTQAIVAFSTAAALASYIDSDLSLILHLCGNSTTGKTTMLQLAASVWGSAKRNSNGIIQSWHATSNALVNTLCGYNGITLCFDELGASETDAKAYLNLIYVLSMGIDKKRMGYHNQTSNFSVNIISSGELPMKVIDEVNGIDVRLLEIEYQWTENKEHSEQIKAALKGCYGYLGEAFVETLLKFPKGKLNRLLDQINKKILRHYDDDVNTMSEKNKRIFERAVQKIAVVSLSAYLIKKYLGLDFDYAKITYFLIEKSGLMKFPRSPHILFLEAYMNSIAEDSRARKDNEDFYGLVRISFDCKSDDYIIMRRIRFEDVMKRYGYSIEDIHNHLKTLKKEGFLHTEKGKNTVYNRRMFNGVRCQCVEIIKEKLKEEGIYEYSN